MNISNGVRSDLLAKKRQTQSMSLSLVQRFIQSLKQEGELMTWIKIIRDYTAQRTMPSLEQQYADLALNLQTLEEYPLARLQLLRLIDQKEHVLPAALFEKFQAIFNDLLQVTAASRQIIDPYCKSDKDYSSSINQYKKWLLHVLYIVVLFAPLNSMDDEKAMSDILGYFNHIYTGTTTSRVSLREQANIQAPVVLEIARNTVHVFGQPVHQHWLEVEVVVDEDDRRYHGYLQAVYVKAQS